MSPYTLYRSDQQRNRCPTCRVYYVYEGEMPTGKVVHEQHNNPYPAQVDDTGKCVEKRPFYKRVTYSECPRCRSIRPTYDPVKKREPMPEVSDLEGLT